MFGTRISSVNPHPGFYFVTKKKVLESSDLGLVGRSVDEVVDTESPFESLW